MPTNTLPKRSPSTKIDAPSLCCLPGAGPHCASISFRYARAAHDRWPGCARARWRRRRTRSVAADDFLAQRIDDSPADPRDSPRRQALQRAVQRFEHREKGRGARIARIRRKIEQHDADLCEPRAGARRIATSFATRAASMAARSGCDRPYPCDELGRRAAAEHHRAGGAVEFRNRHHDGGLHRQQSALRAPIARGSGTRRDARRYRAHPALARVSSAAFESLYAGPPTREKPVKETSASIWTAPSFTKNCSMAGRASRPAAKAGNHAQPARLERGDDPVVVRGVAGEQIGAQQQHSHRALAVARPWCGEDPPRVR